MLTYWRIKDLQCVLFHCNPGTYILDDSYHLFYDNNKKYTLSLSPVVVTAFPQEMNSMLLQVQNTVQIQNTSIDSQLSMVRTDHNRPGISGIVVIYSIKQIHRHVGATKCICTLGLWHTKLEDTAL